MRRLLCVCIIHRVESDPQSSEEDGKHREKTAEGRQRELQSERVQRQVYNNNIPG